MSEVISFYTGKKIENEKLEIGYDDIDFVSEDKNIIIVAHSDEMDMEESIYSVKDYAILLSTPDGIGFEWSVGKNTKADLKKLLRKALKEC